MHPGTFANAPGDFRHWRISSWRKSYWQNSGTPRKIVNTECNRSNEYLIRILAYLYVKENPIDFDSMKRLVYRQWSVDKHRWCCLMLEIDGDDNVIVIWHENTILYNEFVVSRVLYNDRHRSVRNALSCLSKGETADFCMWSNFKVLGATSHVLVATLNYFTCT
jgi:hypothetical protein